MKRFIIEIGTEGNGDIVNLNPELSKHLKGMKEEGVLHLFIVGSTAALTTIEFEPGLVKHDMPRLLQKLIPEDDSYEHEMTWNDDNGHSHLRASLIGPSLTAACQTYLGTTGEIQLAAAGSGLLVGEYRDYTTGARVPIQLSR